MTIHNVRIFRVSPFFVRQNSTKAAQLNHENVGCLSDFGCGVLMSSVWNNVGTTAQKAAQLSHENVGCLSDFGGGVLMSSVWNNVGTTFFQILDTSTLQPKAEKLPTVLFLRVLLCCLTAVLSLEKTGLRPTQKTRTLCNVILNKRSL